MEFRKTHLEGVYHILLEPRVDLRGSFLRTFSRDGFERQGLNGHIEQCNLVINEPRGTLRGIHYHVRPAGEVKIVQCVRGAVFDVVIDLRPESVSYGEWVSHELTGDRPELLYIPKGMAHAYQTLEPHSTVSYFMSEAFVAGTERGAPWDDAWFSIPWPLSNPVLSERDRAHPPFDSERHRREHGTRSPSEPEPHRREQGSRASSDPDRGRPRIGDADHREDRRTEETS
jgi:dTDP-4-dehydrorhamnose 3,5-epimerase